MPAEEETCSGEQARRLRGHILPPARIKVHLPIRDDRNQVAHAKIHRVRPPFLFSSLEEAMSLPSRHRWSSQENHIGSGDTPVLVSRLRLQGLSTPKTEVALLAIRPLPITFNRCTRTLQKNRLQLNQWLATTDQARGALSSRFRCQTFPCPTSLVFPGREA